MPGNQGLTSVTIIETSHIAVHVWDEVSPALMQMDVYSCAECADSASNYGELSMT